MAFTVNYLNKNKVCGNSWIVNTACCRSISLKYNLSNVLPYINGNVGKHITSQFLYADLHTNNAFNTARKLLITRNKLTTPKLFLFTTLHCEQRICYHSVRICILPQKRSCKDARTVFYFPLHIAARLSLFDDRP